jgi:hypothetical protein
MMLTARYRLHDRYVSPFSKNAPTAFTVITANASIYKQDNYSHNNVTHINIEY